jgi:hypothetical protein
VSDAIDDAPEWEKRLELKFMALKRTRTQQKSDRYNNSHEMLLLLLERKLKYAVMSAHQGAGDSDSAAVRKNLTTRLVAIQL